MKKLFMILPMVILLCFTFGCQQDEEVAEAPAVDIAAEEAAIREANIAWAKAGEAKDVEGMTSFLADDCALTATANWRDKASYQERWTEQFSLEGREVSWATDKIVVADSGDLAYSLGTAEHTRIIEGETRTTKSTFLAVWKKQPDGSWKVVAGF